MSDIYNAKGEMGVLMFLIIFATKLKFYGIFYDDCFTKFKDSSCIHGVRWMYLYSANEKYGTC